MFEVKYFRDYKHSYIILQCIGDADNNYQCKLLTSGRIKEILHCSLRYVNGMAYFYYDISSRTTLEGLYRSRQMSFLQVQELFEQLYAIYRSLGDNFMEESGLVLSPEHIYYDFSNKKYIGLYYPDYESEKPYEALMDFLLEHLDGQDERLADCIYQIYERTEESGFSLLDALQILGRAEVTDKAAAKEETTPAEKENVILAFDYTEKEREDVISFSLPEEKPCPPAEKEEETGKKKGFFHPFLMILSVFGILGAGYIYFSFALSEEEVLILFGCSALMGVCFLAGLVGICGGGKKKKKAGTKSETEEKIFMPKEEEYFSAGDNIPLEQVLDKDMALSYDAPKENAGEAFCAEPEECKNTVFFDSEKLAEYKLYALDKKNKKHIELKQFPCTVGKMAGCVDCVLTDDSVSRIHAKFEKTKDVVLMTDMNSTNGTYKNGLRLQPQETVEIEPGDEIRFGNLNYCYR